MKKTLLCSALLLSCIFLIAQDDLPQDYFTKEFHAGRREAARQQMPANSVMAVFAYPERNYSNDVDYFFHQNPDMYYFSGYKEPHSLLLIFKEPQTNSTGETFNEILFVQEKNAAREQWTGKRLGVEGAKDKLGFKMAANGKEFSNFNIDLLKFEKIILANLPADLAPGRMGNADLYNLIAAFKTKTNMPDTMRKDKRFDARLFYDITASLREIKTPEEKLMIRKLFARI